MKAFLRDLLSVARSKGIVLACGLGNGIIMARWLGPAQVGIYAGLMVYPHLFMSVGSLGLQQSTTYLLGRGLYDRDALTRAIFQTWVLSSTTTVLASYLLIRFVSSWGESTILALLATAPVPFILFNRYNGGLFLGSNDIPAYNRINWIPALLGFGATAVALIVLDAGLVGALVAGIVGPAAMSALLAARNAFLTRVDLRPDWELIRTMLSLGAVYAIALMVINLNYRLDIVILDRLSTEYEIGIYSKAVSPIEYLWQIPMLLGTIIFARSATTKDGVRFSRSVQQLLRLSLIAMVAAAAVLGLLADQVVTLLYGNDFLPSGRVLLVLVPGVVLLTIFKVLNMDLAGKGKPWVALKAMVPALVINVALNIVLVPSQGAWGAAAASTISYSVAALLFLGFYAREVDVPVWEVISFRASDFAPLRRLAGAFASRDST